MKRDNWRFFLFFFLTRREATQSMSIICSLLRECLSMLQKKRMENVCQFLTQCTVPNAAHLQSYNLACIILPYLTVSKTRPHSKKERVKKMW